MFKKYPIVEYRKVLGFPAYRVGTDGSVWSRWNHIKLRKRGQPIGKKWKRLRTPTNVVGYPCVKLCAIGRKHTVALVHSLVLTAFVGPRPKGFQGAHYDGNKTNNNLSNLRWDTRAGNQADRIRHGTSNRGERQGQSKLTAEQVIEIRQRWEKGEGCTSISRDYPVNRPAIQKIVLRQRWNHI